MKLLTYQENFGFYVWIMSFGHVGHVEIGVEYRKIFIAVVFQCCYEMYFGAYSIYIKGF